MYVNDIFITENWTGRELLCPNFCMDVNDIFITEKWTGRELLCPKFFVYMYVNDVDIFITENWTLNPKFLYTCLKMLFLIH